MAERELGFSVLPVFLISTFDTDYLLVRDRDLEDAVGRLQSVAALAPPPV